MRVKHILLNGANLLTSSFHVFILYPILPTKALNQFPNGFRGKLPLVLVAGPKRGKGNELTVGKRGNGQERIESDYCSEVIRRTLCPLEWAGYQGLCLGGSLGLNRNVAFFYPQASDMSHEFRFAVCKSALSSRSRIAAKDCKACLGNFMVAVIN